MADTTIVDLTRALEKLVAKMEGRADCPFTEGEIERIKRAASLIEWLDMSGKVWKWGITMIGVVAALLTQWQRVVDFFTGGGAQ